VYAWFNTGIKWFLAILMMIIAALTFYQVIMRYVFNRAPSWSEELVRFLFVWCTFVAAAIGIKEGIHIGIDALVRLLPKSMQRILRILVQGIVMFFGSCMIYYGWKVIVMTSRQPSPALGLPMSYVYASIPVMGVLILVYGSQEILKSLKGLA
jgi:TRAP-type C4-dicarboxylate transport system permease small subunit